MTDPNIVVPFLEFTRDGETAHLKKLTIVGDHAPDILAGAATNLEALKARLSSAQAEAVLTRICNIPDLRLSQLELLTSELSLVAPEVLVMAVQRLEKAWFVLGNMTAEQATAILNVVKEDRLGRIKEIQIIGNYGMSSVSTSLLQEAKMNKKLVWH